MKKILKLDSSYRVIEGEGVEIMDNLPKGVYELKFAEMQGFWFEKIELEAFPGKVYGNQNALTEKVLKRYAAMSGRNLGVLLSGQKGTGKSLFVKNLAVRLSQDIPVIIIKTNYGKGMLNMLANVKGKVALVFDEFEKMFRRSDLPGNGGGDTRENDIREQESALSFFDGVETRQEKLILLTVNETYNLSKYLLGRPGRIHYHFKMVIPTFEEIKEYLSDNLDEEHKRQANDLASQLASRAVSWDSLAAFVLEINSGESFDDTIRDLNISSDTAMYTKLTLKAIYEDGSETTNRIDFDDSEEILETTFRRHLDRGKFKVDTVWTEVRFPITCLEPTGGLGEYRASSFEQDSAEDCDDNIIEGAPRIKDVIVYRTSALNSVMASRRPMLSMIM